MNFLLPSKIVHWSSGPPGLCCKSLQVQLEVGNGYEHPWLPHRLIMNSHCARSISILLRKNTDNNTTVHYDVFQFSRVSLALCSSVFRDTQISMLFFVKKMLMVIPLLLLAVTPSRPSRSSKLRPVLPAGDGGSPKVIQAKSEFFVAGKIKGLRQGEESEIQEFTSFTNLLADFWQE